MYFEEPVTDFRTHLNTDDGDKAEIDFSVDKSVWQLKADHGVSRQTLRDMVVYLHQQFYAGEDGFLRDWLSIIDDAAMGSEPVTIYLKTVDRL